MQHKHPESRSNQHIKGILQKDSSGVFQGKVVVSKDAQKTDAFQFNQNLLLSENAEVNIKPELEIYADDVKCSHGATTGELDEQMLFYLRSRGLNKEESKKILIEGFVNELFENVANKELKKKLLLTSKKIIY
jgi:Fe-S cluster assembly protein SufD